MNVAQVRVVLVGLGNAGEGESLEVAKLIIYVLRNDDSALTKALPASPVPILNKWLLRGGTTRIMDPSTYCSESDQI